MTTTEKTATEKTSVKRFSGLTIALIILCVVFIVATIGVTAYYVPLTNSLNSKISSLNSQISSLKSSTIAQLQSQLSNDSSIIALQKNTVWVNDQTVSEPARSYFTWTFSASNAGYVAVQVLSSTVVSTQVEAQYSSNVLNYTGTQTTRAGSSAVFPILPSSNITIGVGSENLFSSATETVTITYYY